MCDDRKNFITEVLHIYLYYPIIMILKIETNVHKVKKKGGDV